MNKKSKVSSLKYSESLFSAISAGFFFVLVGAIFVATPNLFDKILAFFYDFDLLSVFSIGAAKILLPAPANPETHSVVYSVVVQFSLIWGLYQIFVSALRFAASSPIGKKAETVSNIVYWLGTSYLFNTFLNGTKNTTTWFALWAQIIMLLGLSLIVRAAILAIRKK